MNCKNWWAKKSAATNAPAGSNSYPRFPKQLRENSSASNSASCKIGGPTMLHSDYSSCLRVEKARISGQTREISRASGRPLHDKAAVVQKQCAQPGKLFAAASSPRTAVQATRPNVAVPGELSADAGIHNHYAPMQIADAEHDTLEKGGIVRKNRSDERTKTAPRNRDEVFHSIVCHQRRYRAEHFDVV